MTLVHHFRTEHSTGMNCIVMATRLLILAALAAPAAASDMGSPLMWALFLTVLGLNLFIAPGVTVGALLVAKTNSWRSFAWALPVGLLYGTLSFALGMEARLLPCILVINACGGLAATIHLALAAPKGKRPWLLLLTTTSALVPVATAVYLHDWK